MNQDYTNKAIKKVYEAPELKNLGKVGEVTNTTSSDGTHQADGGGGPNYYS